MDIKRDEYLNKLLRKRNNGLIKVVTGIKGCGKSYLLFHIFHNHLISEGIPEDHILEVALDDRSNKALRNPDEMLKYIKNKIVDKDMYYIILDEVQYMNEFEDVLNSFLHIPNCDVYVTGSNSKFLSSDVITEFRGRGDEICIHPLSFSEFISAYQGPQENALDEYMVYGGLPMILSLSEPEDKTAYLKDLFNKVYLSDIVERHHIRNKDELDELVDVLSSSIGSYASISKLTRTFKNVKQAEITDKTIKKYIDYLIDSFLVNKAVRYDIKGRKYIGSSSKYYFEDIGLRNARLGFRQVEEPHIMENIIYNELRIRGYDVDIGMMDKFEKLSSGKVERKHLEVDFIATKGSEKHYVQSALAISSIEKWNQEKRSLISIPDSFQKLIVLGHYQEVRRDENGIVTMGLPNFLLDKNSLSR